MPRPVRLTARSRTAVAASVACLVVLMAGAHGQSPPSASEDLPARLASGAAPRASTGTQQGARSDEAALVDLQRQVNDLRSDLLDERERQISRWQGANGAVLVVLGVMIGIGGLWAYAKLRSIADQASIGAAAARHYVRVPQGPLPEAKAPPRTSRRGSRAAPASRFRRSGIRARRRAAGRGGRFGQPPAGRSRHYSRPGQPGPRPGRAAAARGSLRRLQRGDPPRPAQPGPLRRARRRALRAGPRRGSHRRLRPGDQPRPGQRHGLPQALPGKTPTSAATKRPSRTTNA